MTAKETLKITEADLTTIVKDFSAFTKYIKEHSPSLTRKGHFLTRKTLYEIDQLLSNPIPENRPQTSEIFYPHLNLFYHLALKGTLCVQHKLQLQKTERLSLYEQLTSTEKYFFLLETLWVDINLGTLLEQPSLFSLVPEAQTIVGYLARTPPGKVLPLGSSEDLWGTFLKTGSFWHYLSFFGLCQVTFVNKDKPRKNSFVDSVIVTDLGGVLFPILYRERDLEEWNIPYIQRETEDIVVFPGLAEDQNEEEYEPFFKPFQKFFKGELSRTLPRSREHEKGTYVFKVSLRENLWRTIVVSSEHTLENFHEAIQDAFNFDRDHLYAFFTDGVPWSHNRVMAPECDEGPSASCVRIGELQLHRGQQVLYVFDFGSEWRFTVEVLEIKSESGPVDPVIGERKGKSPEQYPEW